MNIKIKELAVGVIIAVVACMLGCGANDDAPVSPNAATAAPAHAPGVDPHAHTIRGSEPKNNK